MGEDEIFEAGTAFENTANPANGYEITKLIRQMTHFR
jgi:hypothetical protein